MKEKTIEELARIAKLEQLIVEMLKDLHSSKLAEGLATQHDEMVEALTKSGATPVNELEEAANKRILDRLIESKDPFFLSRIYAD